MTPSTHLHLAVLTTHKRCPVAGRCSPHRAHTKASRCRPHLAEFLFANNSSVKLEVEDG